MAGEGSSQRARPSEPRYNAQGMLLCHAHNKRGGMCQQRAMVNQKVCRYHGGAQPAAIRAGKRRKLLEDITEKARQEQMLGPQQTYRNARDAVEGLFRIADRSEWMLNFLTKKIQGMTEIRWRSDSEQLRAEADLWDRQIAKQATTLATIVRLAQTERAHVEEDIAQAVLRAINGSLRAGGLEGAALERARAEAYRLLRLERPAKEPQALPPGDAV